MTANTDVNFRRFTKEPRSVKSLASTTPFAYSSELSDIMHHGQEVDFFQKRRGSVGSWSAIYNYFRFGITSSNRGMRSIASLTVYLVLGALTLSPILSNPVPALVDYPNHLARMWILAKNGGIPELSSNYVANWRLLPNLAMDLIVPTLGGFMTVQAAGRLFIALTACLLVTGTMALHRALHGKVGLWPATTFLFVYNAALFWGFLNFLFGA